MDTQGAANREGASYPDFRDLRDENTVLSGLFAGQQAQVSLQDQGPALRAWAWYGSWNQFEVLGVRPAAGRFFRPEDDRPGQPLTAVLSHRCWQSRFQGDPGILGRSLRLGGRSCQVLGVAPAGFFGPVGGIDYDVFVPLEPFIHGGGDPEADLEARDSRSFYLLGRLKPGLGLDTARQSLRALNATLATRHPRTNQGVRLNVYALRDAPMGAPALLAKPMALLFVGVAFLLLLATANVANLLLARAAGRERELALRTALGAGRGRLVGQLLTESALLGLAGGAGGMLVASWSLQLFLRCLPPTNLPITFALHLDLPALLFALGLALATALLFGTLPALRGTGRAPAAALKDGAARSGAGPHTRRAQSALAALEMALAVTLLAGAGLMVKSSLALGQASPGFEPRGLLFADLGLDLGPIGAPEAARLGRELLDRVRALPGVEAVTFSEGMPLSFGGPKGVGGALEGGDPDPRAGRLSFARNVVGPDFFRTLRIPLLAGREFTADDREDTQPVVMVNETLAVRFWPGQDPVGRRLRINGVWRTVVGVGRDFKFQSWSEPPTPFVYLPFEQWRVRTWNLVARVASPDQAAALRRTVTALDPALPVQVSDLGQVARASGFLVRTSALAMTGLGLVALFLASVGIYGVMAHAVSQRTAEMGIRMALGATPRGLILMVLRQGLSLAVAGAALGLAGAYALGQRFQDLLHRTSPTDPLVFTAVPLLLLGVAALACVLPALRAASVPPTEALRSE